MYIGYLYSAHAHVDDYYHQLMAKQATDESELLLWASYCWLHV